LLIVNNRLLIHRLEKMISLKIGVSRFWHDAADLFFTGCPNKNPLAVAGKGVFITLEGSKRFQPQEPPHEPELQLPPPPSGLVEVIEKPERYPASMKSTLMAPHLSRRS